MTDYLGKLLVKSHTPRRRAAWGVIAVAALALLYAAFELGRYDAHYRVVDALRGALAASARIRALEAQNAEQRRELEAAEVGRRVDRESYKQIERTLGDMQSQIARLNQDLSFYRGLIEPDSLIHVKVQQMQIIPEPVRGRYRLKFVLMQTGKPDNVVSGTAAITLEGLEQGRPVSLSLAQVSAARRPAVSYSFRYFADYDERLQLPSGFEPTRVGVEIRSSKDRDFSHSFRQAFVWKAQGMSVETEAGHAASPGAKGVDAGSE